MCRNLVANHEKTRKGESGEGEEPYLAPEGRYVYSWATCKYLKAPEGRYVYSGATCAL